MPKDRSKHRGPLKRGKTGSFSINKELDRIEALIPGTATEETAGTVLQGAAVADAAGEAPTTAEFLALLTSLREAGIIAEA